MRKIFDEELSKLNEEMLEMGVLTERILEKSINLLANTDEGMLDEIYSYEKNISEMESKIQNHCLRLLIEHQPVAIDLRIISSILKMITDMKRIGEQSRDIGIICLKIDEKIDKNSFEHIRQMGKETLEIITQTINSFAKNDLELAKSIEKKDDIVDNYFRKVKDDLVNQIKAGADGSNLSIDFILIAKYLERTADHAVNMSKWIIFSIEG